MSFLDSAVKDFKQNSDAELHRIDVPEYGEAIWIKSASGMNGTQAQRLIKAAEVGGVESLVNVIILRARGEDGIRLLKPSDKETMMTQVRTSVLNSIVEKINEIDMAAEVEVKKY